jgi:transglutaminase-like putative cysteine protease
MSNSTSDTPLIILLRHRDGPALWSITDLASEIATRCNDPEEAATRLHELVVDWRYHYFPSTPLPPDVPRTPEDLIRAYGYGLCHESAGAQVNLFRSVGLKARLRGLGSHVVAETFFDKSWHMFDPDGNAMIRGPSGRIASVDDLIEAPEYIPTGIVRRAGASSSISTENLVDLFLQARNATTNEERTSRLSSVLRTIDWIAPLVKPGESVSLHYSDPWSF